MGMEMTACVGGLMAQAQAAAQAETKDEENVAADISFDEEVSFKPAIDDKKVSCKPATKDEEVVFRPVDQPSLAAETDISSVAVHAGDFSSSSSEAVEVESNDAPLIGFHDFLSHVQVRFLDKLTSKRRTTMLPPPAPVAFTASDVATIGCVVLPELETLQWGCDFLVETTEGLKGNLAQLEAGVAARNPSLFRVVSTMNEDELELVREEFAALKQQSRAVAKHQWHTWRCKLETTVHTNLMEEYKALEDDSQFLAHHGSRVRAALAQMGARGAELTHEIGTVRRILLTESQIVEARAAATREAAAVQHLSALAKRRAAVEAERRAMDDSLATLAARAASLRASNTELNAALADESRDIKSSDIDALAQANEVLLQLHDWKVTSLSEGRVEMTLTHGGGAEEEEDGVSVDLTLNLAARTGRYGRAVADARVVVRGDSLTSMLFRHVDASYFRCEALGQYCTDMSVAYGRAASMAKDIVRFLSVHACESRLDEHGYIMQVPLVCHHRLVALQVNFTHQFRDMCALPVSYTLQVTIGKLDTAPLLEAMNRVPIGPDIAQRQLNALRNALWQQ
eukprot:UC1_evm1s2033